MELQGDFFDEQYGFDFDNKVVDKKSMLEEVVESILAEIQHNPDGSWVMPWSKTLGLPINAKTGKPYQGRNMLLLWASASRNGFRSNRWATFKTWQQMRAPVPKGYKATRIFKPVKLDGKGPDVDRDGDLTFRPVPVFNADQVNHRSEMQADLFPLNPDFDESKAEELIGAIDVEVQFKGKRAYYNIKDDIIVIPPRSSFVGSSTSSADETYYSTIFHELVHSTGHPEKCNRTLGGHPGSTEYAKEELVAEIGATLLCHSLGITPVIRPDHVQYIQHWKRILKDEPENMIAAAKLAVEAVKYLQLSTAQITLEF